MDSKLKKKQWCEERMRLRTNFIEMKSNQKYNKTYPKKIQNIKLRRKKSNSSSDSLFLQQLAVMVGEFLGSLFTPLYYIFKFYHVQKCRTNYKVCDAFGRKCRNSCRAKLPLSYINSKLFKFENVH